MKVAIIGRTEILYKTIELLRSNSHEIVCILTAKEAPEYKRTALDFKNLAQQLRIPFAMGSKISDFHEFLKAVNADISVSINYSGIIPQSVINLFPLGVLNAHGGDLPRYRGNACQAWAILNGENRVGLCIHKMIGGELDSGDIIAREYLNIFDHTKITEVYKWMEGQIPELFYKSIQELEKNPKYVLEKQSKDSMDILRCYPRKPSDSKIIWSLSVTEVLRLINASNKPFSGAFCHYKHQMLTIWDACKSNSSYKFCAVPGQITQLENDFMEVACGEGKIIIKNIEYLGERIVPKKFFSSLRDRLN